MNGVKCIGSIADLVFAVAVATEVMGRAAELQQQFELRRWRGWAGSGRGLTAPRSGSAACYPDAAAAARERCFWSWMECGCCH